MNQMSLPASSIWDRIRSDFHLDPDLIHLVGFWLSSHPRGVRESIARHRDELDRNPYVYLRDYEAEFDNAVRAALARFLGISSDTSIVLTESTTSGLALVLAGLSIPAGCDVVTTTHEHYSAWKITETFARRSGAHLKRFPLYREWEDFSEKSLVSSVVEHVSKETAVLVLTWVHSDTGLLLPISSICNALRTKLGGEACPLIIVDATHAIGAIPLALDRSGCDIVVASCHKWLLGPRGTAFVWGHEEALAKIDSWIPTFSKSAVSDFAGRPASVLPVGERLTPGGFHCFEHRWAVREAVEYLEVIGSNEVFSRIRELSSALNKGLTAIDGVQVITPQTPDQSAGFVCFEVVGRDSQFVCAELEKRRVLCSPGPYRRSFCRFSPFIFNSMNDVALAIDAVNDVVAQLRSQV